MEPTPAPGWYPDPHVPGSKIYWNGTDWIRPAGGTQTKDADARNQGPITVGVCILLVVGLVMSMQSTSLMTGSTLVWTGVAVTAVGAAAAFMLRAATWVRVVALIVVALALFSAIYVEVQLSQRRDEITQMFSR